MAPDPRHTDARRFRWVLALTLVAYAGAGAAIYFTEAPPAFQLKEPKYRIAQLLLKSDEDARKKAEEEARKKAEEEAKRKAEEEARRQAEEEARRKAEAEARRKAEEEARKRAEEEAKRRAEEEAKRKAEEEARRLADAEARKKAEEEARKKAEEAAEQRAADEARRQAEEALRKAEEERRLAEEAKRKAEEEAKRQAEEARIRAEQEAKRQAQEEARRQAEEAARLAAEEEARRKAEEEARRQAEEAARLAKVRALLELKRQREEEARRNQEAAMSAGLMAGMDNLDEDVQEFLPESQKPLVGSPEGNLLGGEAPPPKTDTSKAPASGGGIPQADLADIDQLLGNLEDIEGIDKILGDDVADQPASKEELLAFLNDVAAGRVSGPMVAHATAVVQSPFRILGEAGGVNIRNANDIERIILSHRPELNGMYSKALVSNPGFQGDVNVFMVITAEGNVREARAVASNTGVPAFDQAVVARVLTWHFPAVTAGEVSGTYVFRFTEAR